MAYRKKPGYMGRAIAAWVVLNTIMVLMFAVVYWLLHESFGQWYITLPTLVALLVCEASIVSQTIGPIVSEWVKQEGYEKD